MNIEKFISDNFDTCCNNHEGTISESLFRELMEDKIILTLDEIMDYTNINTEKYHLKKSLV